MNDQAQTIRPIPDSGLAWAPARGDATDALGEYLVERGELPSREAFDRIVSDSVEIVGRCPEFRGRDRVATGLVVGYVQSGKTMSMTTVASLARDNGCRLVILFAGTTSNLLEQTARKRLAPYLRDPYEHRRAWRVIDTVETTDLRQYEASLAEWVRDWRSERLPEDRKRPVFITVMKNHAHLKQLSALLRRTGMAGIPSLILDDEADQAGLDTNASKRARRSRRGSSAPTPASTTHRWIREIRETLPHHTYLQYTATPQAPLLISLADILSPDFAHVLTPGEGYTGGRVFFVERPQLVLEIPTGDLFNPSRPPPSPPLSLQWAMQDFLIGAAVAAKQRTKGVRSMLVHPSQRKGDHEAFLRFVQDLRREWKDEIRLGPTDRTRAALMDEFRSAYARIALGRYPGLPDFETIAEELPFVLDDIQVWRVNSEDGREVDWKASPAHILVGGDKLNRGYTVEGLTVTYMPRSPGGWNADTIQQRARFFGYKGAYIGLCRLHLHPDVADAYRDYVEHEEDIRGQLRRHAGRPLKEWKRAFLLNHQINATRGNVLSEVVARVGHGGWFRQSYPHAAQTVYEENRRVVDKVVADVDFQPHPRVSRHGVATMRLHDLMTEFLVDYRCWGPDAETWTACRLWLAELLEQQPEALCEVVYIQQGAPRERTEHPDYVGRINQLFEGGAGRDETLRSPERVTIQLHRLDVNARGAPRDVPAIAVHLPDNFTPRDYQVQRRRTT